MKLPTYANFSKRAPESVVELMMKKKTTITSEKHEVWKIRRGDDYDSTASEDATIDVDQPHPSPTVTALPDPNETRTDED